MKTVLRPLAEDLAALNLMPLQESAETETGLEEGNLDEARRMVRAKRKTSAQKMLAKKAYRKNRAASKIASRKYRKSAAGKKAIHKLALWHSKHGPSRAGYRASMEDINLESLQIESVDFTDRDAIKKAFAQLTLGMLQLAENFEAFEDEDYAAIAAHLKEAAEESGALATALNEGEEFDEESAKEAFEESLEEFVDALEVYNEATGEETEEASDEEDAEGNSD